jgi:aspartate aminotransferase-like enzyme
MPALRTRRPFSLDHKLDALDQYLPPGRRVCEVRLLAVDPSKRQGIVLRGLLERLVRECDARGLDLAVLSATVRQLRLYRHLGCVPFGPRVGPSEASFQPMYVTREALLAHAGRALGRGPAPACFLTGPVSMPLAVRRALRAPPSSHRGEAFAADLARVRHGLSSLIGARHVAVFAGSGTLANDVVAAQMAREDAPVLVLSNGEFGERLADHARRHRFAHTVLQLPWGAPFDLDTVDAELRRTQARWLWVVHCETSTGMLNDLDGLRDTASRRGAQMALDAASSVGTVPFHLDGIALASTVSGKALGAVAGLSIVCSADVPSPCDMPRYLDLAAYLTGDGVPFTQSSLLVGALAEAIAGTDWPARHTAIRRLDHVLRDRLAADGHQAVVSGAFASPAVATWQLPPGLEPEELAGRMESRGFALSWQSSYLRRRRWVQTALMGEFDRGAVAPMADALAGEFTRAGRVSGK